jgi:hypothetical protein
LMAAFGVSYIRHVGKLRQVVSLTRRDGDGERGPLEHGVFSIPA